MKITRNVILDLLPLYSAGEVSADTRALIDKYLETDPELANVAKQMADLERTKESPAPVFQDDKMKAYRIARRKNLIYIILLASGISIILITILIMFFLPAS